MWYTWDAKKYQPRNEPDKSAVEEDDLLHTLVFRLLSAVLIGSDTNKDLLEFEAFKYSKYCPYPSFESYKYHML